MAARHVREGESRVAAQVALIGRLERHVLTRVLPRARDLLAQMHAFQDMAEEHLRRELEMLRRGG